MAKNIKQKSAATTAVKNYKVSGQVFNANGEPIMGQNVQAADVDLIGAAVYKTIASIRELKANKGFNLLGTAKTDTDGYYEIPFTSEMYRRNEMGLADVIVFTFDADKITARSVLADESDYRNNELLHWDIHLPDSSKRGVSEYDRLIAVLGPFVKQSGLELFQLNPSADQVSFLATETRQDPLHTSLAVQSDQLKNDCQASKSTSSGFLKEDIQFFDELFYGIGRQGIALTWTSLFMVRQADVLTAIEKSIAQNIISSQEDMVIEAFIAIVTHVARERSGIATETAPFYKAISFTLKDAVMQKVFAQAYVQNNSSSSNFWNSLSQQSGFTADIIASLQLTNQLSILTCQHTALIEELQVTQGIKDPSDLLSMTTDNWNTLIQKVGVPSSVQGDTPEQKASYYVTGMQNLLNAAYPTQRIALMINASQIPISDATLKGKISAFFTAAPDFDISSSRITDPDFDSILKKVAGNLYSQAQQQVQIMQRIFQVSPTPAVMGVLLTKGYTSAYHISRISQHVFIAREATDLGGAEVALSVYNRARHHAMTAHQTVLKIYDTQDRATPSKIITSGQQQAISNYLTNLNSN